MILTIPHCMRISLATQPETSTVGSESSLAYLYSLSCTWSHQLIRSGAGESPVKAVSIIAFTTAFHSSQLCTICKYFYKQNILHLLVWDEGHWDDHSEWPTLGAACLVHHKGRHWHKHKVPVHWHVVQLFVVAATASFLSYSGYSYFGVWM